MNRILCLLFTVCLAVALVKSETTVEVDENGEIYDVKKFHIQGRQLIGGRPQCVVTRRKRSTQPTTLYADNGNDEVDKIDDGDGDVIKDEEQSNVAYYSPSTNSTDDKFPLSINSADDREENMQEVEKGDENPLDMNKNKEKDDAMNNTKESYTDDKMKQERGNDNNKTTKVVQLPQLPLIGELQSAGESAAGVASIASSNANGGIGIDSNSPVNFDSNDIFVIHSYGPPKVNPQTHAVFELVPVNHVIASTGDADDDFDIREDMVLKKDLNPITTTAIWSTGNDDSGDFYDDLDHQPVRPEKVIKKTVSKKRQNSMQPTRRNKYNTSYKINSNKKRPIRRYTLRGGSKSTPRPRPRPQKNQKNKINNQKQNKKKNKNSMNNPPRKKIRGNGSNNKFVNKNQKNTMAQKGSITCIIIQKDPLPTTPRPFWNILGRTANDAPRPSGHYGQRKRVNIRFEA